MMLRYLFLAVMTLLSSIHGLAQSKINWTGKVVDSTTKEILELATVAVNDSKDSSMVTYTLTDNKGHFKLESLPVGKTLVLLISYTGYKQYRRVIKVEPGENKDLGTFILSPSSRSLNEVVVEGEKPPIAFKNDTLEFNASSFKTKPNAVVEDLLKKLPGVDVDQDGKITVNGKPVSRVLVDGKEFFGNDPKIATKNLPKEIVDKIQVVDTKTKVQELLGQKTDGEDKTINITLKEDKKNGLFGRITGGIGTQHRYDASAMVNMFNKKRQFSVLGAVNNLNNTGFSMDDMMGVQNGGGNRGVAVSVSGGNMSISANGITLGGIGGEGIRRIATGGINYNEDFSQKLKMNGSYFYNYADTRTESSIRRENINLDTSTFYNERRSGVGTSENNRLDMNLTYSIDSTTTLIVQPNLSNTQSTNFARSIASTTNEDGSLINSSNTVNRSESNNLNFRNNMSLVKQLNKKGRSLSLEFNNNYGKNTSDGYVEAENHYVIGGQDSMTLINQYTRSIGDNQGYGGSITYIEPLNKVLRLELRYGVNYSLNNTERRTYNYDPSKGYDDLDSLYSNKFRSTTLQQTPQVTLNLQGKKFSGTIGGGMQFNTLKNYSYFLDDSITLRQQSFVPNTRITYAFSNFTRIGLNYSLYTQQPTIDQLQPVQDNTNTLFQRLGNPDLKSAFRHNIGFNFNTGTPKGFFMGLNGSFSPVTNNITNETYFDEKGVQISRPINVGGNYGSNIFMYSSFSKKTKDWNHRINLNGGVSMNKSISYTTKSNKERLENETYNYSVAPSLNYNITFKELFDISPGYRINYRKNTSTLNAMGNTDFVSHTASFSNALYWPKNFVWENDINYTYNSNMSPGYRKDFTLWNMSVSRMMLKNNRGTIKLSVYDLLNQNTSVRRNVSQYSIEDTQTMIVQQYFMLSFTYNISSFGGGTAPARKAGGPRMMRF
ncbi:TonB-dependent receptor [uncultured Chitinophaga sp.]|uniref:TonB-dependent receptor n=1 Tax=uncultured Chitinophaga sp. TaxID=339340 RepID=UPI0025EAA250|nr:TonB-dependent receptor [uncultured Chitinophaga sp.]